MENFSYITLSRQLSLYRQMNMTANNIANMSTPGYKAENILFTEYLNKGGGAEEKQIAQVQDFATYKDTAQGVLKRTDNQFDVAIEGEGFFAVKTDNGTEYTRAGSFTLNKGRELVTKDGQQVLSDGGAPIVIPEEATDITISKSGTVSSNAGEVGKIKVVSFDDLNKLIPDGNNLLLAGEAKEMPATNVNVQQGMIEQSNVQPVLEMTKMIDIQRMFEATQNMINADHDLQRNTISKLTRV